MPHPRNRHGESGNVIVFILMAVVLIGVVTAAIRSGGGERANIDQEQLVIRAAEVRQHASEFERAVAYLIQSGVSEYDIRFAHGNAPSTYGTVSDTPEHQAFSRAGGGAEYRTPAPGLQVTPGPWEFYGNTALPQAGSARADLVAVLPDVTPEFCAEINKGANLTGATPVDDGAGDSNCVHSGSALRFSSSSQYTEASPNTMDEGSFSSLPAPQGCVSCTGAGGLHFYHMLLSR